MISLKSTAQEHSSYRVTRKGQITLSWGWNRAFYTRSDIHMKGADYDFTLYNVKAHDRPTLPVSFHNYLQPNRLTVPQTNFRISYFIKDNLALSFGDDHMKYVMDQYQTVPIKGVITRSGPYQGTYAKDITLTKDFLKFEHTNGLNYLNVELEKYHTWYHSRSDKCIVSGMFGGGTGILFPRTDATLMSYERNDRFHVSGFGLSAKLGLQGTFFKHAVVKLENKLGYINMPDILLHKKGIQGRGKQSFFFEEIYGSIGGTFPLVRAKKRKRSGKEAD